MKGNNEINYLLSCCTFYLCTISENSEFMIYHILQQDSQPAQIFGHSLEVRWHSGGTQAAKLLRSQLETHRSFQFM